MSMSHWADEPLDDDPEDSFVRPYTITHGRTVSTHLELTLITLVVALTPPEEQLGTRGLEPEHRFILEQCRTPVALAEIAARLNLPVAVAKILIGDLITLGTVAARPPVALAVGQRPDIRLLQAVRDGLRRL
ncbi:MAG TPA: DUF742 domain-containing protein [Actinocrinis sp.]|jgi:hypothetical protein|uniref:DUF742 domain-containing protein n=1 Tax=Actinocrinis sp. TaxID=1920516 RepID=UPI002DDD078C|nr:DUF742 domain-containing protein [Actinocrinis sp.]HEV3172342.1 DUF742 domain-containing protein [Actinocrinis sp.]